MFGFARRGAATDAITQSEPEPSNSAQRDLATVINVGHALNKVNSMTAELEKVRLLLEECVSPRRSDEVDVEFRRFVLNAHGQSRTTAKKAACQAFYELLRAAFPTDVCLLPRSNMLAIRSTDMIVHEWRQYHRLPAFVFDFVNQDSLLNCTATFFVTPQQYNALVSAEIDATPLQTFESVKCSG